MLRLFLDLNQDSQKKKINQNNDLGLSGFVMRRQNCSSSFFGVEYLFNEAWRYLKFIYSEKVTKFFESKVGGRFRKILWPSQKI